ncbi:MAG TPA: hypothetical protein DER01_01160 [Phycisphaerales bacterium]|nr:hypothetical protein [Phycisphaerales bacterium]|tara:strand:- start:1082 stop:1612 length:531 start_codon:yes stop_codon:yes gene_type:complete
MNENQEEINKHFHKDAFNRSFKQLLDVIQHVNPKHQLEIIIIKGHILVEQKLWEYIEKKVPNIAPLKNANLGFRQIFPFANALTNQSHLNFLWPCIKKLDWLRNKLAHKLESHSSAFLEPATNDFINTTKSCLKDRHFFSQSESLNNQVVFCILAIHNLLDDEINPPSTGLRIGSL